MKARGFFSTAVSAVRSFVDKLIPSKRKCRSIQKWAEIPIEKHPERMMDLMDRYLTKPPTLGEAARSYVVPFPDWSTMIYSGDPDPDKLDPRVSYEIEARSALIDEKIMPYIGETIGPDKSRVIVPFPHVSWRIHTDPDKFARIRVIEPDRVSYWTLGQLGGVFIPHKVLKETVFDSNITPNIPPDETKTV